MLTKSIIFWLWTGSFVCLVLFHLGPGRLVSKLDTIESLILEVRSSEALGQWDKASKTYSKALNILGPVAPYQLQNTVQLRLKLAKARSELLSARLLSSILLLEELSDSQELTNKDITLYSEIRATLAQAHYELGWKSRLETEGESDWRDNVEKAMNHFHWLAEWALNEGDLELIERYRANLELTIRLLRMERSVFDTLSKKNVSKIPQDDLSTLEM